MSPMPAMDSGIATGALFRAASSCGSELERVQLDTRARVQNHESLFVYTLFRGKKEKERRREHWYRHVHVGVSVSHVFFFF